MATPGVVHSPAHRYEAGSITRAEWRHRRDRLSRRALHIYQVAPDTDYASYAEAQQAFQQNEELTFSMLEIDLMLPAMLRDEPREQTHLE